MLRDYWPHSTSLRPGFVAATKDAIIVPALHSQAKITSRRTRITTISVVPLKTRRILSTPPSGNDLAGTKRNRYYRRMFHRANCGRKKGTGTPSEPPWDVEM
jgi:hypothetical protein